MKTTIHITLISILCYLAFAFVLAEIDPFLWDIIDRLLLMIILVISVFAYMGGRMVFIENA